jgi:hypothetical protein
MYSLEPILNAYHQGQERTRDLARSSTEWWLEDLELATDLALEEATRAVRSVQHGHLREALHHANWACAWERREYVKDTIWRPLRLAVRSAAKKQGVLKVKRKPQVPALTD